MHILQGIEKYTLALNKLSKQSSISRFYLYLDCLWSYIRYGCVINHYTEGNFYLRCCFERNRIFTYKKWLKVLKYNDGYYTHLLKKKDDFNKFFHDYIGRNWLFSKGLSYKSFISFLMKHHRIFIKPVDGLEGHGCKIVEYNNGADYHQLYENLIKSGYMIEEVVDQHPLMVFGNKAVNTIRVYTIYDKKLRKAICIKTTLRVGIGDSIVDNSLSGGVSYEVDLDTGIIDSRGMRVNDENGYLFHPGTDICMMGFKIPFWKNVLSICVDAASLIPQVRFIGWDVAITQKGPILIEGNNAPGVGILEFVGNYGYYNIIMSHLK